MKKTIFTTVSLILIAGVGYGAYQLFSSKLSSPPSENNEVEIPASRNDLFVYVGEEVKPPGTQLAYIRQEKVQIRFDLLEDKTINNINLNLFDDLNYEVTKDRVEGAGSADYTWYGKIAIPGHEVEAGIVIFVVAEGNVMAGSIPAVPGVTRYLYQVTSLVGEPYHLLIQVDQSKFGPD